MNRIILFLLITLTACQEEKIIEVGLKGTLIGYVQTSMINATPGNATITVEGTVPEITVTSDAEGKFVIENLQTGTYDLVCKRAGYSPYKLIGYSFVGGDVPANVTMYMIKLLNLKISDLTVATTTLGDTRRIEGTATLDLSQSHGSYYDYKFRYYMSKSPKVSYKDYEETGIVTLTSFSTNWVKFYKNINTTKFQPGTDVYFALYPCADETLSYIDVETGKLIYSSIDLEGSQVKSIKVPL